MNTPKPFLIPENTPILWRNVDHDLKLKRHTTEQPLSFDELRCTGDGGLTYYFELGDWLIVVDAEHVVDQTNVKLGEIQPVNAKVQLSIVSQSATSFQRSLSPQASVSHVPLLRLNRA